MINSVNANYLKSVQTPQFAGKVVSNATSPEEQKPQAPAFMGESSKEVTSKESVEALKSYVAPQIIPSIPLFPEKIYIEHLKKMGKVEGKDFKIEKDDIYTDIIILNKEGKDGKVLTFENVDGKSKYIGSEEYEYKGDRKISTTSKNADGRVKALTHHYYNDEIDPKIISRDGLTYDTPVDEYKKKLTQNGIRFTEQIETDQWGSKNLIVEEYDTEGRPTQKTIWVTCTKDKKDNYIYRELINKEGRTFGSIYFDEEQTAVSHYPLNYFPI